MQGVGLCDFAVSGVKARSASGGVGVGEDKYTYTNEKSRSAGTETYL